MTKVSKKIAVLAGDGIGPEVTEQGIKVLKSIAQTYGHNFQFHHALVGAVAIDETGNPLPNETIDICNECDAILFGAIGHPKYDNDPNAPVRPEQGLLKLRKSLGLFSNIRPVKAYETLLHISPLKAENIKETDFVIYRELTGGIYFGKKHRSEDRKTASDDCVYHVEEIERVAHQAFKAAQTRRKKLTLVDKANVLETSRLWRETVQRMANEYPDVTLDFLFVDNAAMQIIINPKQFDVILTENMFGDIISDEASVITGSLGLLPSASVGEKTALFEPIHGSYPQAAGLDIANPVAAILSAAMLLDYFGLAEEANCVRNAVNTLLEANVVTKDLNPKKFYATSTIGDLTADIIAEKNHDNIRNIKHVALGNSTII
ncbi:MAG: 3-isopropylmalate dehydrogenase [Bacteroidota bacterium]|jgi:3-isopropylmalate dehydrogenase